MYQGRSLGLKIGFGGCEVGGYGGTDVFTHHHCGGHVEADPSAGGDYHCECYRTCALAGERKDASCGHEEEYCKESVAGEAVECGLDSRHFACCREIVHHIGHSEEYECEAQYGFACDFPLFPFHHKEDEAEGYERVGYGPDS